jgi:ABC-2 type transport system permease protein
MHSAFAVARRVLQQFLHDKRTLAIMLLAPCIVLWLFSVLLGAPSYPPRIAAVDLPQTYLDHLQNERCTVTQTDAGTAESLLQSNRTDAVLSMGDNRTLQVEVEGADASKTAATVSTVRSALVETQRVGKDTLTSQVDAMRNDIDSIDLDIDQAVLDRLPQSTRQSIEAVNAVQNEIPDIDAAMPITDTQVSYLHGSGSWTGFDFYGPVFIGIFIFVFVFLTASMSLLTERSGGTIDRLISTPIASWQIVGGYILGFGLLTCVQSALILWFCIQIIGFPNAGSLPLVVGITVSMALASLTLGLLVSGLARTPFQVIQLMLVFVVPQILLSGIFDLSQTPGWMQVIAAALPIYYGADALRDVMLRGAGIGQVAGDIEAIWLFIAAFFLLSCPIFAKKRARTLTKTSTNA